MTPRFGFLGHRFDLVCRGKSSADRLINEFRFTELLRPRFTLLNRIGKLEKTTDFDIDKACLFDQSRLVDSHIWTGEMELTLLQPTTNRVGIALALQGLLETGSLGDGDSGESSWQVFSVLRLSAPLAF